GPFSSRNAAAACTEATLILAGTDVWTASASDSALSSSDTVQVAVLPAAPPPNTAPVVNAGLDLTVTLPAAALLHGTVSDDGLPSPPAATTAAWTVDSGPGPVSFLRAAAADTQAPF